jgi:hypothetical protein
MTVQVSHKKLYYNYYTLGKYLLKIQISGKILRQPPPSNFRCFATSLYVDVYSGRKTQKNFPKGFLKWPKKDKFLALS